MDHQLIIQGVIDIESGVRDDWAYIDISDNGVGMTEQEKGLVFEPFYSTKINVEGSGGGLGLTISKNIVEEFGGELKVSSEKSAGAKVTILLPLNV